MPRLALISNGLRLWSIRAPFLIVIWSARKLVGVPPRKFSDWIGLA